MKFSPIFVALLVALFSSPAAAAPWKEILGPPRGTVPAAAGFTVTWRTNLARAMTEAREQNRPLFVTFRCLPCKQCADFDKAVLEGGPDLDPILTQFVTVRLTDAAEIDFRIFPVEGFQDLDLSWWGWLLSPQGKIYGVFGGRDHLSDATRISKPALIASLLRVLAHHYDPRRPGWDIDGPAPDLTSAPRTLRQLPGYAGWVRMIGPSERQTCIHCHQVNDILREPAVTAKTFDKHRDFEVWPLPENAGITLDRDHGLRVTSIEPGSPAAKAGLRPGDLLGAAEGQRLFGQADFRGALHRGPRGPGRMEIWWTRGGEAMNGQLEVAEGWRKTVLDWRMSVSQGIVGVYPGFFPIGINAERRERLRIDPGRMAVEPFMGTNTKSAAYLAGVRQSQVVTAVNGESPDLTGRAFLVWFIMRFDPGDEVTYTVAEGPEKRRDIICRLPPHGGE